MGAVGAEKCLDSLAVQARWMEHRRRGVAIAVSGVADREATWVDTCISGLPPSLSFFFDSAATRMASVRRRCWQNASSFQLHDHEHGW